MDPRRCKHHEHSHKMGVLAGGALIIMGVAFLLAQLNLLGDMEAWDFWPLILVLGGILKIVSRGGAPRRVEGIVLLSAGTLAQLHYIGIIHLQWKMIWPSLLILLGLLMLCSSWFRSRKKPKSRLSTSQLDGYVVLGGKENRVDSKDFEGGEIFCVMGGYELDLSQAELKDGEATLNIRVVMGGVDIRVPEDWRISIQATPIMGAFEDKTRGPRADESEDKPLLIIQGSALMGGVELRN